MWSLFRRQVNTFDHFLPEWPWCWCQWRQPQNPQAERNHARLSLRKFLSLNICGQSNRLWRHCCLSLEQQWAQAAQKESGQTVKYRRLETMQLPCTFQALMNPTWLNPGDTRYISRSPFGTLVSFTMTVTWGEAMVPRPHCRLADPNPLGSELQTSTFSSSGKGAELCTFTSWWTLLVYASGRHWALGLLNFHWTSWVWISLPQQDPCKKCSDRWNFYYIYNASHHVQFETASTPRHPKTPRPREASLALAFGAQEQLSPQQTP